MSTGHNDIANALREHRSEISCSLNPSQLWSHMCGVDLVKPSEYEDFKDLSRSRQVEFLLDVVEKKGRAREGAYLNFLHCLETAKEHLGHAYAASLLSGRPFASETDINTSAMLKQKIQKNMSAMMNINTHALVPFLIRNHLLTFDEAEIFLNKTTTNQEKNNILFGWLETKGPTAHYLFASCLREEKDHPTHHQLLSLISSDVDDDEDDVEEDNEVRPVLRKRKALEDVAVPAVKVTRRDPGQVKAHGALSSQLYYDKVKEIRRLHYFAQWEMAEKIVEECRQSGDQELYIAVMLRNCSGYVTRKQTDIVKSTVAKAYRLLDEVDNDNGVVLRSRCEWMLAKMYRYMNNSEEAQKHVETALSIHFRFNVQPGEDTALSNYCQACILLESIAKNWCPREIDYARKCLKTATDHAVLGDYGLYVSHHHIRLAQLCLHSSQHQAGTCTDPNLLKEAGNALKGVDEDVLAPRTSCLFYLTKSDLYRNMKRSIEAKKYAEMAHEIAKSNSFKTELHSAKQRLQVLEITELQDSNPAETQQVN